MKNTIEKMPSFKDIGKSSYLFKSSYSKQNKEDQISLNVVMTSKMVKLEQDSPNAFWPKNIFVSGNKRFRTVTCEKDIKDDVENWLLNFGCWVNEEIDEEK